MTTFHFNMDHWIKVLNAREKAGLYLRRNYNNEIKNHPLVGKKVICLDSDKEYYTVDKVFRQWHLGFYICLALVDSNRSHRIIYWENVCCHEKLILDSIAENHRILQFIE